MIRGANKDATDASYADQFRGTAEFHAGCHQFVLVLLFNLIRCHFRHFGGLAIHQWRVSFGCFGNRPGPFFRTFERDLKSICGQREGVFGIDARMQDLHFTLHDHEVAVIDLAVHGHPPRPAEPARSIDAKPGGRRGASLRLRTR